MKESHLQDRVGIIAVPRTVRPASNPEYVRFIQPLGETFAVDVLTEAEKIIAQDYPNHPWFQSNVCYRKAGKDGIRGSSLDLNVVVESVLRPLGLSLPSLSEGKHLDARRALSNGVYREYGFQVASQGDPNADLSKHLIAEAKAEAKKRNWQFPIVIPSYHPLGHRKGDSGFEIYFLGDKEGIDLEREVLHGEKAQGFLRTHFNPDWIGKNGVLRLFRNCGYWDALDYIRGSYDAGRVDFVSGEASAKNVGS